MEAGWPPKKVISKNTTTGDKRARDRIVVYHHYQVNECSCEHVSREVSLRRDNPPTGVALSHGDKKDI